MKWTMQLGAAALMLGISASAPAGLFNGLFSTHGGHGDDCCPQPVVEPCCEAPCEVDCTSDGCLSGGKHRRGKFFGRLCDVFKRDRGLCDHETGCANEGCCPQDCHAGPVGRASVGGPIGQPGPYQARPTQGSPAPVPNREAAPAPTTEAPAEEAPAPTDPPEAAPEAEAAPAPPAPEEAPEAGALEAPEAAPAPAPPEDAEAYFPSRYRR